MSEMKMKNLPRFLLLAFCGLYNSAQASTIYDIQSGVTVFADTVAGHSGLYYDQTFSGDLTSSITGNAISAAVTGSDLTKYAWTADSRIPTGPANAYIDLSFSNNIYNGDGADLVLFFAGNGTRFKDGHIEPFLFSIDVGADGVNEGGLFGVTTTTTSAIYGNKFYASYALIDLDAFGYDKTTPLGNIRVYLGDSSMPALAALGAYHTTVVPLPLSSVLFSSGLALLGWIGRRKTL